MKDLLVFIDGEQTDTKNPIEAAYRWSWVYADGEFESDFGFDIVLFNQEEPSYEGYFLATAINNRTVIINMVANEDGRLQGRCCYIDDYESLKHINSPQDWR